MHTLDKLCQARVDLDQVQSAYRRYISTSMLFGFMFVAILIIGWFVPVALVAAIPCLLVLGAIDKLVDITELAETKSDAEQEYEELTKIYDETIYDDIYQFVV